MARRLGLLVVAAVGWAAACHLAVGADEFSIGTTTTSGAAAQGGSTAGGAGGEGGSGTTAGSGGTPAGTGGAGGSGAQGGSGGTGCDGTGQCLVCLDCSTNGPCQGQWSTCQGSAECQAFWGCMQACTLTCYDYCVTQHPTGEALFRTALQCSVCNACAQDCLTASFLIPGLCT